MARTSPLTNYFEEAKQRAIADGADLNLLRRIADLQSAMQARGIEANDRRIPDYIAALVPLDSRRLLTIAGAGPADARGNTLLQGAAITDSWPDKLDRALRRAVAHARQLAAIARRDWKRLLGIVGPWLAILALLLIVWIFRPDSKPKAEPGGPSGGQQVDSPPPPPTEGETVANLEFYLLLAAIWISALGLWLLLRWWRRQILSRDNNADLSPVINLSRKFGRMNMFSGLKAELAWRQLRLRRQASSSRVDIRASLKATLAQAGYPAIRFDTRRVRPEYLIFSEREMPQDHLPEVGRALYQQMTERQIDAMHYEFQHAPYRLRLDDSVISKNTHKGFELIGSVLLRHEGARVLVSMESFDAVVNQSDAIASRPLAPSWLGKLSDQQRPFLLNPRGREWWSREEQLLAEHSLPSVPATTDGLQDYARHVVTDYVGSSPDSATHRSDDLPAFFSIEREWLIARTPLEPRQHEAVIDNLLVWLSPKEMTWLRCLALFPAIHSSFTHFSAMALFGAGEMEHVDFLKIARLPWFRVGNMPDWLRQPLAIGMSAGDLEQAKAVIQAFFAPEAGQCGGVDEIFQLRLTQQKRRKQEQFRRRMQNSNIPLLSDNLLRSAFEHPDPLRLSITPIIAAPIAWHRRAEVRTILATLLASTLLPLQQWPTREQPVPTLAVKDENVAETPSVRQEDVPEATLPDTSDPDPVAADDSAAQATGNASTGTGEENAIEPEPSDASRTIYVQIASELDRSEAMLIVKSLYGLRLKGSTPIIPGIEVRENSPTTTEVRCFNVESCRNVPAIVTALAGSDIRPEIRDLSDTGLGGASKPIEIWFSDAEIEDQRKPPVIVRRTVPTPKPPPPVNEIDEEFDRQYDKGNFIEAYNLNSQSCLLRSQRGCYWNGYLHEAAKGVPRDLAQAEHWYRKACDLGYRQACTDAGRVARLIAQEASPTAD